MRELAEAPAVTAFRARFEAGRSFDLDDDLEFCPNLLTEDDVCCDRRPPKSLPSPLWTPFRRLASPPWEILGGKLRSHEPPPEQLG